MIKGLRNYKTLKNFFFQRDTLYPVKHLIRSFFQKTCLTRYWIRLCILKCTIIQTKIWESRKQELLGIIIDRNLRFGEYVLNQCKKGGRKLIALTRTCKFMSLERRRILMKSFIGSQFGCCPLVWIFCGKKSNNHINYLYKRALRIIYNDNQSSFENFLREDRSVSIHHRNTRSFAIAWCV